MRTMLKAQFPVGPGNAAIVSGVLPKTIQATMDTLKPEAAYFFAVDGLRTAIFVFDLKATSDIPSIAEPLFQQLQASVQFIPVMNADDLQAGLKKVQAGA